jgi:hypothetical protein
MFEYRRLGLSIALCLSVANMLSPQAISSGIPQRWVAKKYKVPPVGSPLRREAAATRGGSTLGQGTCPQDTPIALIPKEGLSATTSTYPTLFFRMPSVAANKPLPAKFTLLDGDRAIYRTNFQLVGERRTIGISLPSTEKLPPLTIDKNYRWSLTIQCSTANQESVRIDLAGMIRRVVPDALLAAKLQALSESPTTPNNPLQLAELYAESEIWQDALMQIVSARKLQPNNPQVTAQWQSLLESAQLNSVVNDPLAPD